MTSRPTACRSTRAASISTPTSFSAASASAYCISEGWVKVQAGKSMDRHGNPLLLKLNGPVEAWYEDLGEGAPVAKKA